MSTYFAIPIGVACVGAAMSTLGGALYTAGGRRMRDEEREVARILSEQPSSDAPIPTGLGSMLSQTAGFFLLRAGLPLTFVGAPWALVSVSMVLAMADAANR